MSTLKPSDQTIASLLELRSELENTNTTNSNEMLAKLDMCLFGECMVTANANADVCDCDLVSISGCCADRFNATYKGKTYEGYVNRQLGIGSGDYIEIEYCVKCGRIKGEFPLDNIDDVFDQEDEDDEYTWD
jgi:hypothetical protein